MTYTEFLKELTAWGDRAVRESPGKKKIQEEFRILCTRAGESVQKGGFSPFFYVLLSAGLNREEALFLSAVLYSEISRQEFVQVLFSVSGFIFPGRDRKRGDPDTSCTAGVSFFIQGDSSGTENSGDVLVLQRRRKASLSGEQCAAI